MRHYAPREIVRNGKPTGLFRFTCKHDKDVYPVGPCAGDCPGHSTPEAASLHYWEDCLARASFYEMEQPRPCKKCQAPTLCVAEVDGTVVSLCKEHSTIDVLRDVTTPPSYIFKS